MFFMKLTVDPDLEPGEDNLSRKRRASLSVVKKFFAVGGNRLFLLMQKNRRAPVVVSA
jgi:hypothetical protein